MKTLKDYTETELKAFKSDLYETISKCQNDLAIINQELKERATVNQPEVEDEPIEPVEEKKDDDKED